MDDPFSNGFPFELDDIWRQSAFQVDTKDASLFPLLATDFSQLELQDSVDSFQQDFQLPALSEVNSIDEQEPERIESEVPSPVTTPPTPGSPGQDNNADIWTLDIGPDSKADLPRLYTWEAFEKKTVPYAEHTPCLSEAEPATFDSALTRLKPQGASSGVLPQDVMLRALCNLALGRSSIFFQWDVQKNRFIRTLKDVPISGYSLLCSSSFTERLIDFGSMYRCLDELTASVDPSRQHCTAVIALEGCIRIVINSVERHITTRMTKIRSLLQLQGVTERPHQILKTMEMLFHSSRGCRTDEEAISHISHEVEQIVSTNNDHAEVLRAILARVSAPWLERLRLDLGLSSSRNGQELISLSDDEDNVGIEADLSFEGRTSTVAAMPTFVQSQDRALVQETKNSLRLLRQHMLTEPALTTYNDIVPYLTFGESAMLRIDTSTYMVLADTLQPSEVSASPTNYERPERPIDDSDTELLAWAGDSEQHDYLAELHTRMSQAPPSVRSMTDPLQLAVARDLDGCHFEARSDSNATLLDTNYDPLSRMRPLLQRHARVVNKTLLRYLFKECRLLHHLDVQRQYHLFTNGPFVARLAKALFDTDTQSAERKRGMVPTGETMGLRLDAREERRWPPASSELRLTLMGVLTETYRPEPQVRNKNVKELPGGLSFAIRELPEKEIENVLDSGCVFALDFLRLQYSAPAPLDVILTPTSLQAYDDIFRFLLRTLRMLNVTTRLRERVLAYHRQANDKNRNAAARFASEAHHFISILVAHVLDIGVEKPWQKLISSLMDVERALEKNDLQENAEQDSAVGLGGLRKLHEATLDSIRSRLFLRKKYEKVRNGIQNVFTAILKCAAILEKDSATNLPGGLLLFHSSFLELNQLLQVSIEKVGKNVLSGHTAESDIEAMKLLLMRLNWNDFYQ